MSATNTVNAQQWRILLCHKHPFSARLSFLVPKNTTGVLFPEPLPALSVISESRQNVAVQCHPSSALRIFQESIGVNRTIEIDSEFELFIETPNGLVPVYLATLEGNELFPAPDNACWVELLQCVERPWLDREILRRAYEVMIG